MNSIACIGVWGDTHIRLGMQVYRMQQWSSKMSRVSECLRQQMRELVSQGIQGMLLIHVGAIVLTETIDALYYSGNKRISTPGTIGGVDKRNVQRNNKMS